VVKGLLDSTDHKWKYSAKWGRKKAEISEFEQIIPRRGKEWKKRAGDVVEIFYYE